MKGPLNEYYHHAYGLKIAAISSTKASDPNEGNIDNKNLYNDKELFDDADLDWYDYGFRNYDAQIGRFTQLDPLTWDYPDLTNYQYASDEPIANVDMDGLESITSVTTIGNQATSGFYNVIVNSGASHVAQAGTGAALKGIIPSVAVNVLATAANTVSSIKNIPNNVSDSWQNVKGNASNYWNDAKNSVSDWWGNLKDNISNKAARENKPVWQETVEIGLSVDLNDPMSSLGGPEGGEIKILSKSLGQDVEREVLHHSYPKFLGGEVNQNRTLMKESEHVQLHRDLNDHLVKYQNEAGEHMRPQSNNSGRNIQRNFSEEERVRAMKDFYNGPGAKYKNAARDFFKQHP